VGIRLGKTGGRGGKEPSGSVDLEGDLSRAYCRLLATYGWTPVEVEAMTPSQVLSALAGSSVLRQDRIADLACAARLARIDDNRSFASALQDLSA
jgi:hypothetical protein